MGYFTRPFRKPHPRGLVGAPAEKKTDALASRYFVEDLPPASVPATSLRNVLELLQSGRPIPARALAYLQRANLRVLHDLAAGLLSDDAFKSAASAEQALRAKRAAADSAARAEEASVRELARQEAQKKMWQQREDAQMRFEASPAGVTRRRNLELRERFCISGYVDGALYPRLLDVMHRLLEGGRLGDDDVLWLNTEAREHHTPEIRAAFHANEAAHYTCLFDSTGNPWHAITASGHWRRAERSSDALVLLDRVSTTKLVSSKLRSALYTTRGGVMRDLRRHEEAVDLGNKAHALLPRDFRPCTLLGALHMEMGAFDEGKRWYDMALARGASAAAIDSDLRAIFMRSDRRRQEELRSFLLEQDAQQFAWARPNLLEQGSARARHNASQK